MGDPQAFNDAVLERDIRSLEISIEQWAVRHDLWLDCGFKTFAEHVDAEPDDQPVASVQYYTSQFRDAIYDELADEFHDLVRSHGFYYEDPDGSSLHYVPEEGPRCEAFADFFRWQWICGLVREDFADVHEELYARFADRPDDLHRLSWREFEILLARIFQTQGFDVELGSGGNDGGVDLRLLQRDPLGDLLTLVQAKKYAPHRGIGLEAVAALSGIAGVEEADRSMFVTTSSYQPVARRFAARTSGALDLRTSADVAEWCRTARDGIIRDKSLLVAPAALGRVLREIGEQRDARIVHARGGYNTVRNLFALVIKETRHAALLMALPHQIVSDDGYGQRGFEVPLLGLKALPMLREDCVWRAKRKSYGNGHVGYWDGRNLYTAWDGEAQLFDHCD